MTTNNKLKTIIYDRGSLQVLDQRELPSKYQYVEINNSTDGRNAIKDMVVRGASAVAIVAALSLAVEVDKLKLKKEQAAAFLKNRLDDLVLSRPTIANLSNAATELKEIASNAVAKGNVFKAYIKDAKAMLEKDVDSNRQIGSYGAQFLHEKIPNKKISVLTHCNTGNLATAGYGTAYGVICNLFARQMLDRVYCTETRPFNEGSRLTVLELLNQKIPAALIADSAAASLMGGERVNVVIVGANCIAANGDTANTIGTYSLSIYARCHKIPFYVVAPFTSIDLSLSTGQEFEIEERSGKELLHLWEGQIDEKSAASMGLHVWNPVFDVTPAKQIDAIITNKGVIEKINGAFDIKGFVANHSPAPTKNLTRKQPARRCKNYKR